MRRSAAILLVLAWGAACSSFSSAADDPATQTDGGTDAPPPADPPIAIFTDSFEGEGACGAWSGDDANTTSAPGRDGGYACQICSLVDDAGTFVGAYRTFSPHGAGVYELVFFAKPGEAGIEAKGRVKVGLEEQYGSSTSLETSDWTMVQTKLTVVAEEPDSGMAAAFFNGPKNGCIVVDDVVLSHHAP